MDGPVRTMEWPGTDRGRPEALLTREWLVTNGLGGYASCTVSGVCTCRYHGMLVAALPNPLGRQMMFNHLTERGRLLTPVGLRSLAPGHPDYKREYFGDLRTRDAAYHQGTVWPWLIGPFIDAWLKLRPEDRAGARGFLEGFVSHLGEACIGSASEIFDAEEPFTPRGCIAQAWSVAEVLRGWVRTGEPGEARG